MTTDQMREIFENVEFLFNDNWKGEYSEDFEETYGVKLEVAQAMLSGLFNAAYAQATKGE